MMIKAIRTSNDEINWDLWTSSLSFQTTEIWCRYFYACIFLHLWQTKNIMATWHLSKFRVVLKPQVASVHHLPARGTSHVQLTQKLRHFTFQWSKNLLLQHWIRRHNVCSCCKVLYSNCICNTRINFARYW